MDSNTRDVAMAVIEIISVIVTALMLIRVNKSNSKIDTVKTEVQSVIAKVAVVEEKLDENHKQMNGNIDKLVKSSVDLATAKEKARGIEEAKEEPKK